MHAAEICIPIIATVIQYSYIHTYIHIHSYTEHMSTTSPCHLSLFAAMLAVSVNDRPMVATSFFTMSIQRNGGRPRGLLTSDISRASVRACAAGELGAALTQWPNHFNLLRCTV